jgi:hypothetical protein
MASYSIADMTAVGAFYATKLKAAGIRSTGKLLERARTPRGRKQLAEVSGIPETNILSWAKLADLMRVKGIAEDYAELLSAAGVDTVKELKRRNAANLAAQLIEVNTRKNLVSVVPTKKRLEGWIEEARMLEPMMMY